MSYVQKFENSQSFMRSRDVSATVAHEHEQCMRDIGANFPRPRGVLKICCQISGLKRPGCVWCSPTSCNTRDVTGSWELGWIMCDIWVSLDVLLCTASILSLGAISIDRYLAVTQPLIYSRRRRSKRLALAMILAVWLAAAAITCPPIFGW